MLALTALEDWYITGLDIHSAYLYGKLDEEIYMEQLEGFAAPRSECKVLHLWCALYGLKQASLVWWRTLDKSLQELGFEAVVDSIKAQFMRKWECQDLGEPKEFLRMHITHKGRAIHLDQCAYLQKVIKRCGMLNAKAASMPLTTGYYALANKDPVNPELCSRFQTVIGSLLYLMLGTRPNIAFAMTHLSRHSMNPSQNHLNKALYIC